MLENSRWSSGTEDVAREGGADSEADEEACRIAWKMAYDQARRRGMDDEAARDYAQGFATHLLERGLYRRHRDLEALRFAAWLRRCLDNAFADAGRAQARREKHEAGWPEMESEGGERLDWECADPGPPPEAGLLREEFWGELMAVLRGLPPETLGMFLRHYLENVPARDLAAALGRSPHAVEEALYRARRRLRKLLEDSGLNEADLCAYIEAFSSSRIECLRPLDNSVE